MHRLGGGGGRENMPLVLPPPQICLLQKFNISQSGQSEYIAAAIYSPCYERYVACYHETHI